MSNYNFKKWQWEKSSKEIGMILRTGAERFFGRIPKLERAFKAKKEVRCIDDGIAGGVRLAGSGILLGLPDAEKIYRKGGFQGITSHEDCDFAARAAKEAGIGEEHGDWYGKKFALSLSERLHIPYRHIGLKEMSRPKQEHIARVIYYDGTGKFDPLASKELPAGFVIVRKYLEAEYAAKELAIAAETAFGPNGFGASFNEKEPLLIVCIGDRRNDALNLEKLTAEVAKFSANPRVRVDGFNAPGNI